MAQNGQIVLCSWGPIPKSIIIYTVIDLRRFRGITEKIFLRRFRGITDIKIANMKSLPKSSAITKNRS